MKKLILATLATTFAANVAIAQSIAEMNGVLAASGRTLYTFDKDAADKSNCNGACAAAWPPFLVKDGDPAPSGLGVITRDDGAKQWAMNGKPLYFFVTDAEPGDVKGDGQGGVWHAIRGTGMRSEAKPAAVTRGADGYRPYGFSY